MPYTSLLLILHRIRATIIASCVGLSVRPIFLEGDSGSQKMLPTFTAQGVLQCVRRIYIFTLTAWLFFIFFPTAPLARWRCAWLMVISIRRDDIICVRIFHEHAAYKNHQRQRKVASHLLRNGVSTFLMEGFTSGWGRHFHLFGRGISIYLRERFPSYWRTDLYLFERRIPLSLCWGVLHLWSGDSHYFGRVIFSSMRDREDREEGTGHNYYFF